MFKDSWSRIIYLHCSAKKRNSGRAVSAGARRFSLYIDLFTFCVGKRPYFTGPSRFFELKGNGIAGFAAARAAGNERSTGCSTAVGARCATNAAAAFAKAALGTISSLRDERRRQTGFQGEVGLENGVETAHRARLIVGDGRCNGRRDEEGASSQQCRQHNLPMEHELSPFFLGQTGYTANSGRREFYRVRRRQ